VSAAHPAYATLEEFGGLRVGECGTGEECAKSDIAFDVVEDAWQVSGWREILRVELVGVAAYHHHHGELYQDTRGRCFGASLVHDAFYYEGSSLAEALERILLGRRARPLLRPDQDEVFLYGSRYGRGDPRIFPVDQYA
jgi:hypothetical protein